MKNISSKNTPKFLISHFNRKHPIDWSGEFKKKSPVNVEIGFGTGDFLIQQAIKFPKENFIGIEIEFPLVQKASKKINNHNIKNIRLLHLDARVAMERLFAQQSIKQIYSLFPFPWPKKKHHHHRLFKRQFLKLVNSRLQKKGTLTIVTDFKPFFEWIILQASGTDFKKTTQEISPEFNTRFERKWKGEGQKVFFSVELQKNKHILVSVRKEAIIQSLSVKSFDPNQFFPENKTGKVSIIFKKFCFDKKSKKGDQSIIVAEQNLTQFFHASIHKESNRWQIAINEKDKILKTEGVKESLKRIKRACDKIKA